MRIRTKNAKVIEQCKAVEKVGSKWGNTCRRLQTLADGRVEYEITYESLLNIGKDFPTLSDHTAEILAG
jgi:hypothetical protein